MAEPEGFTAECDWCHREVVNFVQPPAMVKVTADPGEGHDKSAWWICSECFVALIRTAAGRDWRSKAPDHTEEARA